MQATVNNVTGGLRVCDLNIRRSPETCLPWVISDAASVSLVLFHSILVAVQSQKQLCPYGKEQHFTN